MKAATTPTWQREHIGRQATPDEWVDWFLANDRDGQLEIAEWAIRFAEEANDCLLKHGRRQ